MECVPFVADCAVRTGVELVAHSWDSVVLVALRQGPVRRRDLLTQIGGVSDKVLHESLVRLSARRLVERRGGHEATYELTGLGESLATAPLLQLAV